MKWISRYRIANAFSIRQREKLPKNEKAVIMGPFGSRSDVMGPFLGKVCPLSSKCLGKGTTEVEMDLDLSRRIENAGTNACQMEARGRIGRMEGNTAWHLSTKVGSARLK